MTRTILSPPLACPYCYEKFSARQALFRCHGRLSRDGKRCTLRQDDQLAAHRGIRRDLGPVFWPGGLRAGHTNSAACPDCGGVSTYRVCPVCHSQLPAQFGMVGSRMIGMAGAKDSGKTVYMTVLLHELRNRIGAQFGAALMGADDETQRRFASEYEDELYDRGHMFPSTPRATANDGRVDPLVFRFTAAPGGLRGAKPQQSLMSFFDTAGEDFESQESVDVNTRYLACADGILLLLDPLQMKGARDLAAPGTPLPGTGPLYQSPETILTRVTDQLLKQNRGGRERIDKPIAIVFTKLDTLWHTFPDGSPLRAYPSQKGMFDDGDSRDVHEETRHQLHRWEGGQIDLILRNHYPRHRFFGVSALGRPPTADNDVAASGIQPYRVADPLLWLLSEFGAVPRTREGR
jgi:Double-GTPase 2